MPSPFFFFLRFSSMRCLLFFLLFLPSLSFADTMCQDFVEGPMSGLGFYSGDGEILSGTTVYAIMSTTGSGYDCGTSLTQWALLSDTEFAQWTANDSLCTGEGMDGKGNSWVTKDVISYACTYDTIPASCLNSVKDGDEQGLDCGGSCLATCELLCPDGWPPVESNTWFPEGMCLGGLFPSNALGDCPENTIKNDAGGCIGIEYPLLISSEFSVSDIVNLGIEPIDYSYTGATNVFTQDDTFSAIDNGDGTSTETTVSTVASGSDTSETSETTTRTDIVDNTTNQIISSSIVTVVNEAADDSLSTWGLDGGFPVAEYDADISSDIPEKKNITDAGSFLDDFILTSPFFSVLQTASITTSDTICSIDTDLNFSGHEMTIPFDLCQWESHLIQFGVLLLLVSQFYALLIVYRGWKL